MMSGNQKPGDSSHFAFMAKDLGTNAGPVVPPQLGSLFNKKSLMMRTGKSQPHSLEYGGNLRDTLYLDNGGSSGMD
jgi:hypothetical protein